MKVLIVDDHAIVRRGLKEILADEYPQAVLGEAANAQEAVNCVSRQDWDLVLLDLMLPGRGGLDVLKEIKRARPKLPVLVVSMYPANQFAVLTVKAGAAGYVAKGVAPTKLVSAIKKVLAGGTYLGASLRRKRRRPAGARPRPAARTALRTRIENPA